MRWLLPIVLVPLLCSTAAADHRDGLLDQPEIGARPSMAVRLAERLTVLSNELGLHLAALSADMVHMRVDVLGRTARLRLGGGREDRLFLRLDGDVLFARGGARVKAKLDIGLVGQRLSITLPEVDVVPRSMDGKRYLELRLPLIEGRF